MNKEELVQEVAKKASVSQKEAAEVINAWVDTVQKTVAKGKKVTLVPVFLVSPITVNGALGSPTTNFPFFTQVSYSWL